MYIREAEKPDSRLEELHNFKMKRGHDWNFKDCTKMIGGQMADDPTAGCSYEEWKHGTKNSRDRLATRWTSRCQMAGLRVCGRICTQCTSWAGSILDKGTVTIRGLRKG
jgi:hypothetical protein